GCMESALHLAARGPSSGAFVIVEADCHRAGRTADAAIASLKQGVRRETMFLRISFYILFRPVQERIDLEQPVLLQLQDFGIRPESRLIAADAGNPSFHI